MSTFGENKSKVLSFIESVEEERRSQLATDDFENSTKYKLRVLDKCQNDAKCVCLDDIMSKIYKDAIPLNDEYKQAYTSDIDQAFKQFMDQRCPKGIEYYVKEGIKKGSPFAKKVLEAVEDMVNNEYQQKAFNIEDIDAKDLVFRSNDDTQEKLDLIGKELSADEISQAVRDNVKQTAISEINRAKKEKETLANLEKELAGDVKVDDEQKLESALELRDMARPRDFEPTLFQAIMINKMNDIVPRYESGEFQDVNIFNTLVEEYGKEPTGSIYASPEELAFIEAVKEYTGLSVLKALRLESFDKYRLQSLAYEYAKMV